MVVGLVKQVAGTLPDNCAIRKRTAAFSPRAPARGTGKFPEVMDVVSPRHPRGCQGGLRTTIKNPGNPNGRACSKSWEAATEDEESAGD